jgi:methyl-accepting chemotaxis protein
MPLPGGNLRVAEGVRPATLGAVRRAFSSIVAALALVAGGLACGGDDADDEFKQQYNEAVRPLSELGDDVVASLGGAQGQSDREIAKQFDELSDRFARTRQNLTRLDPPGDAEDEFDELLGSLKETVGDLRAVATAAREGDPAEAQEATEALVETGQEVRRAEDAFRDAVGG